MQSTNSSITYGSVYESENEGEGHGHGHGHPPVVPEVNGVFILIPLIIVLLIAEWRKRKKK